MNKYFYVIPNYFCKIITSFRTRNHRFPVEVGRWTGVPLNDRKCELCEDNEIGDEFHYLLSCQYFKNDRKHFLKQYYYTNANIIKFSQLLNTGNKSQLVKLCKFLDIVMKTIRNNP